MKFKVYNYQTGEIVEKEESCSWITDELERKVTEQHIFRADWLEKYLQIFESELQRFQGTEGREGTMHQYAVFEYTDDEKPYKHYEIMVFNEN